MKARLSHHRYNTNTSKIICFDYIDEFNEDVLYLSKNGKYFLHRKRVVDDKKEDTIIPFSKNDAQIFINECAEREEQWKREYYEQVNK